MLGRTLDFAASVSRGEVSRHRPAAMLMSMPFQHALPSRMCQYRSFSGLGIASTSHNTVLAAAGDDESIAAPRLEDPVVTALTADGIPTSAEQLAALPRPASLLEAWFIFLRVLHWQGHFTDASEQNRQALLTHLFQIRAVYKGMG